MVKTSNLIYRPQSVCSIDASTNSLAFAIFNEKELQSYGKIIFSGSGTYEKVVDAAIKTLDFFNFYGTPEAVVIEHTVYLNSPKTAADLALVQGALLGAMGRAGVKKIKSINPIAWQTYLGNGRLQAKEKEGIRRANPNKSSSWYKNKEREFRKERTIGFINTYYDKCIDDNDIADAIGIGHYAIYNWEKLT